MESGRLNPVFKFCLNEGASEDFLPVRGTPLSTGWDVKAFITEPLKLRKNETVIIPLGFKMFCPPGYWMELESRSSTFVKSGLITLDGKIDEDYSGNVGFACKWVSNSDEEFLIIEPGQRLGQMIPVKRLEMIIEGVSAEEFDELVKARADERGAGGFGSTGK